MKSTKIGYIVPSLDDTTGWGRWACEFLNHVIKRGIEPVLWAPRSAENHASNLNFTCQAHFVLPELFDYLQSRNGIKSIKKIYELSKSIQANTYIHLIHSMDAHPWGLYGFLIAKKFGVPHVITTHGRYGYIAYNKLIDKLLFGQVIQSAAKVITVSDAVKSKIISCFSKLLSPHKVQTILNAIDSDDLAGYTDIRGRKAPPVIISVTRFIPIKDIETSLRAFKLVHERYPDASFLIIGPGNGPSNFYYKEIMALINRENIKGVKILGRIQKAHMENIYKGADVLLHTPRTLPDDFEAYGLIISEAGLYGLPVVATRSGGIPEVVAHGESGILVDERDYEKAAEALLTILDDSEKAKSFGKKGREIALSRNWKYYIDQQMKIYDEVLKVA